MKHPSSRANINNNNLSARLKTKSKISFNLAEAGTDDSTDNIVKTLTTVNGEEIKLVYSLPDKKVSAYVIEWKAGSSQGKAESDATKLTEELKKGAKLIKHEDLPKELASVKDPATFELLLENSYAMTSQLSNRDVKLYMEQM